MTRQTSLRLAILGILAAWTPIALAGQKKPAPAPAPGPAQATPIDRLTVAKDFKVELLYSVPSETQGSWVAMCVDPKGRLIVSDQYGGLLRLTPPPPGKTAAPGIEPIKAEIGEAHGLLWAFDSLYAVVTKGKKLAGGLYRVRDTDGDDQLDAVEFLRELKGVGEHGPHQVLLSPDGQSLHVVAGNHTQLTELSSSRVPRFWDEDHLLPRMWDARGHAKGILAPGGCIYRVSPDGKNWELVSIGYRNSYDAAFNRNGDLFTYDSDMEWDMNTPWYRPTRVCMACSGSELGWRSGTGKWPVYYPDSLPAIVDIGPGSPTGVAFGYGAKFPAKYQDALFICDWSYGKLYAVHLKPDGAAYKAEVEPFISGKPLPLTDLVVNPKDGALYFTIGGRRVQSGLYRVTYTGADAATPAGKPADTPEMALRRSLEKFHGNKDPQAVSAAWPHLSHADRFVRFAARVAIEHQDAASWQEKALSETNTQAALTALLALVRAGDKGLQPRVLEALERLKWEALSHAQRLELLRIYGLAFLRMGKPDAASAQKIAGRLDALYPAPSRDLNSELCQLLVYLEAPGVAGKTLDLLAKAPSQEEQLDYIKSLRMLKTGWTMEQRKTYFAWFTKAANYRGGASFAGFIGNIKTDAIATLDEAAKAELKPVLEAKPVVKETLDVAALLKGRAVVKEWTVDELLPLAEKGMKGRSFEQGRKMFAAAVCYNCHRFDGEGGAMGPDLTGVAGRFSTRDLLEAIIAPSKAISDQYAPVVITKTDGKKVLGVIVNLKGDTWIVNTNMADPNDNTNVPADEVKSVEVSKVSPMPEGLLNTFKEDEILDLLAFLLSGGNARHEMFAGK